VIGPSPRPLLGNTQHSQGRDIHATGGVRTRNPSKHAAADLCLRRHGWLQSEIRNGLLLSKQLQKMTCTKCYKLSDTLFVWVTNQI